MGIDEFTSAELDTKNVLEIYHRIFNVIYELKIIVPYIVAIVKFASYRGKGSVNHVLVIPDIGRDAAVFECDVECLYNSTVIGGIIIRTAIVCNSGNGVFDFYIFQITSALFINVLPRLGVVAVAIHVYAPPMIRAIKVFQMGVGDG